MWLCRCSDVGYGWLERVVYLAEQEWEALWYTDVTLKRTQVQKDDGAVYWWAYNVRMYEFSLGTVGTGGIVSK